MSHFQLPEWRQLSKDEQIEIVNLSTDRTYFVRGGPGTGKSVLAIHRVAKLRDVEPDTSVKLLVYNKPLQLHLKEALDSAELDRTTVQTCHAWILQMTELPPPPNVWDYDWEQVSSLVQERTGGRKTLGHLILDESQDIPRPLLSILNSVSENATIFVDDKQAISDQARRFGMCQIAGIRSIFQHGPNSTFDLTRNFRNTQQILDAAHAIRPPQQHEIVDVAIRQDGPRPAFRQASTEQIVERVETYHSNSPADRIAVVVPRSCETEMHERLSNSNVPVQIYRNRFAYDGTYNPCATGVTVLTYDVIKGLEFDAVFMPFLDDPYLHTAGNQEEMETRQNMVYVASTRARSALEYSHRNAMPPSWLTTALQNACQSGFIRKL